MDYADIENALVTAGFPAAEIDQYGNATSVGFQILDGGNFELEDQRYHVGWVSAPGDEVSDATIDAEQVINARMVEALTAQGIAATYEDGWCVLPADEDEDSYPITPAESR